MVATGGLADLFGLETKSIDVDHLLTLEGLKIIYNRNIK